MNIETYNILKDEEGRILSLDFSLEKQNFEIINIYAPTKNAENPKFYKHLKKNINTKQNIILGGDFNMVEDILLDRQGGNPNNTHMLGFDHLIQTKQANNLVDIWRKENPDKRLFTYRDKNQLIHSRIDRIYIHDKQKDKNVSIIPNSLSDHDAKKVTIEIKKTNISGTGYWKLNTSILKQKSFQSLFKNVWKDWQSEKNKYTSLNQWWKSGKIYFKIIAIKFSTIKNQKINKDLQNLTNNILQEKMKNEPDKT